MRPRSYAINAGLALVYSLIYAWCYVSFLAYNFAYAGVEVFEHDRVFLVCSFAIAVAPILCYRGVRAISSIVSVLIYVLLYIPIVLTFAYGSSKPVDEILVVQLTFMAGMSIPS